LSNLLNEVGSHFWYFEVRVRYRRKKVHVRYLISWWSYCIISQVSELWFGGAKHWRAGL